MSGSIPDPPGAGPSGDETDLLAAEYVLGTLDPSDRAALSREAETDGVLRGAIDAWERRLAPLNSLAPPVPPPPALWPRIEASAWAGPAFATAPPASSSRLREAPTRNNRGLRGWQAAAAAGFALAAVVAGIAVLRPPVPAAPPSITALVPLGQQNPVLLAEVTPDGALNVRPVGVGLHVAPDRDLELWVLKNGEKAPKPLGVMPATGVHLAAGSVPPPGSIGYKLLVSLEPRGGSPTGLPTGPVLFGGSI